MKILLVVRNFNKHQGISRYTVELAERLQTEHEVHLLTANYEYEVPGLTVHDLSVVEKPFWVQILVNAYRSARRIKEIKEENDIDVVHSQGAGSFWCDVLTMHSCHKASIKKHNEIYRKEYSLLKYIFYKIARYLWPLNRVVLFIEKRVVEEKSEKIIAVSKGVKKELVNNYEVSEDKIEVIPNGVDLSKFKPASKKENEVRKKHGIDETDKLLMFCGNNFRGKGLKFIIKALPNLKENVKLLVVGGDSSEFYKKLAGKLGVKERIIFTGLIKENLEKYYQVSDIFVLPTYYESFGLVALEALACGIPVLATEVNGVKGMIDEEANGMFIKRNAEAIAEKVVEVFSNQNSYAEMGKNARKTAENYSWDEVAQRTKKVYQNVKNEQS